MIIKKDSILYHTSNDLFEYKCNNEKQMLFCTFHPSDYMGDNYTYVSLVKIKKIISLLFMIDCIGRTHIFSSLTKQNDNLLKILVKDLKKEKFDGWFSSIKNKSAVEVALINNKDIYEIIETKEIKKNWNNGHYTGNNIILKNWGKFKICTLENPVILNINKIYEEMFRTYKTYELKSKFIGEQTFQIILNNAHINYL